MANYEIVKETDTYMVLKDIGPWDQHRSVTNDVEAVVEELAINLNGRLLYYIDSNGQVDQIIHEKQKFLRFSPGGPK